jgi:hypothetical protein
VGPFVSASRKRTVLFKIDAFPSGDVGRQVSAAEIIERRVGIVRTAPRELFSTR